MNKDLTEERVNELQKGAFGEGEVLSILILGRELERRIRGIFFDRKSDIFVLIDFLKKEGFEAELLKRGFLVCEKVINGESISEEDFSDVNSDFREALERVKEIEKDKARRLLVFFEFFFRAGAGRKILFSLGFGFIFLLFGVQFLAHTKTGRDLVFFIVKVSDSLRNWLLLFFLGLAVIVFAVFFGLLLIDRRSKKGN